MDDAMDLNPGTVMTVTHLRPGAYTVYIYAVYPGSPDQSHFRTSVYVQNSISNNPQIIRGPLNGNVLTQYITHSVHDVVVDSDGVMVVTIKALDRNAWMNGLQLVYHDSPAESLLALTRLEH